MFRLCPGRLTGKLWHSGTLITKSLQGGLSIAQSLVCAPDTVPSPSGTTIALSLLCARRCAAGLNLVRVLHSSWKLQSSQRGRPAPVARVDSRRSLIEATSQPRAISHLCRGVLRTEAAVGYEIGFSIIASFSVSYPQRCQDDRGKWTLRRQVVEACRYRYWFALCSLGGPWPIFPMVGFLWWFAVTELLTRAC